MANQHYVPEWLLKNFCFDMNAKRVFIIYKEQLIIIPQSISRICSEVDYLNTVFGNFDSKFDRIDRDTSVLVRKILSGNIQSLNLDEKDKLIEFVGFQHIRSRAVRSLAQQFVEQLDDSSISESYKQQIIRKLQGDLLKETGNLKIFLKSLNLDIVSKEDSDPDFVIGDSPVLYDPTGYGIYMPISPNKCLWFHCHKSIIPLRSLYINNVQFLSAVHHIVASNESVLRNILDSPVTTQELENLEDSYWKCIIQTKDSVDCINRYSELIDSNLRSLL